MYIEPNTNIKILKDVPIDSTYRNTLYFSDLSSQVNYFIEKQKHSLQKQTYQRVSEGVARVQIASDLLYDCNYMMFQNTNFSAKWFYAFITKVEYVSNTVSTIYFEIDVMQTWMFDIKIKECFVEREHSYTDTAGDNIVTEQIDIGDITCNDVVGTDFFDSYVAVIASAYNPTGQAGGVVSGLFSGLDYTGGLIDTPEQVKQLLDFLQAITDANKQDSVVSIFIMPTAFYTKEVVPKVEVSKVAKNKTIHGYKPKNKKLLTYPYNYLSIECGNNNAIYRYEWFNTETCNFLFTGVVNCNPQIQIVPMGYNGSGTDNANFTEKLVMDGFPQIGWSIDSFRAWLAQEASSTALAGIGSIASIAGGAMTGNPMAMASGIGGLASTVNNTILATNRPNQTKGSSTGVIDVATRTKNFWYKQMQVSLEYARIIDNYFDRFGYATMRVKVPNISSRPHWNYTKTSGCCALGSVPSDDISMIEKIYDTGITFWKNGNEVGNYELDNRP